MSMKNIFFAMILGAPCFVSAAGAHVFIECGHILPSLDNYLRVFSSVNSRGKTVLEIHRQNKSTGLRVDELIPDPSFKDTESEALYSGVSENGKNVSFSLSHECDMTYTCKGTIRIDGAYSETLDCLEK
jgi:hypothetical protein